MIPKVIHYCWFGRNSLPESAIKCINSWKKFFPDMVRMMKRTVPEFIYKNSRFEVYDITDK